MMLSMHRQCLIQKNEKIFLNKKRQNFSAHSKDKVKIIFRKENEYLLNIINAYFVKI
jgi:hypothetical protein